MPTWAIVLLIAAFLGLIVFIIYRTKKAVAVQQKSDGTGVQLRKAAENIPVYGSFVKIAGTVGKPVNHLLEKVNSGITTGLQHIPIAGKYLAMPNQVAGNVVHKINSWIGLT